MPRPKRFQRQPQATLPKRAVAPEKARVRTAIGCQRKPERLRMSEKHLGPRYQCNRHAHQPPLGHRDGVNSPAIAAKTHGIWATMPDVCGCCRCVTNIHENVAASAPMQAPARLTYLRKSKSFPLRADTGKNTSRAKAGHREPAVQQPVERMVESFLSFAGDKVTAEIRGSNRTPPLQASGIEITHRQFKQAEIAMNRNPSAEHRQGQACRKQEKGRQ